MEQKITNVKTYSEELNKKHEQLQEIIDAYNNGELVQYRPYKSYDNKWINLESKKFALDYEYRIISKDDYRQFEIIDEFLRYQKLNGKVVVGHDGTTYETFINCNEKIALLKIVDENDNKVFYKEVDFYEFFHHYFYLDGTHCGKKRIHERDFTSGKPSAF